VVKALEVWKVWESLVGLGKFAARRVCQELTVMRLLSQCSSQRCNVYTYILALVESSSQHLFKQNRHRPLCPILLLF
jgi:hypothetical protein